MKLLSRILFFVLFLGMCGSVFAAGLDKILDGVGQYEYGKSRMPLTELENTVKAAYSSPVELLAIEKTLAEFLVTDATLTGKDFVCRQLALIGGEHCIPTLGLLLADPDTCDIARYALERIPGDSSNKMLLTMLGKTKGNCRIGIINSIGVRRINDAVKALSKLTADSDKQVAAAAINALGQIASADAADVLSKIISKGGDDVVSLASDSYLKCADQLAADGKKKDALKVYDKISRQSDDPMLKTAAFIGMIEASDDPTDILVSTIDSKDAVLQGQAILMADKIRGSYNIKEAADKIEKLPVSRQVRLLLALADTGDTVILPTVLKSIKSSDVKVRIAAIKALKPVGSSPVVGVLANIAANTRGQEQTQARNTLYGMMGNGVNEVILTMLSGADAKTAKELVIAVGKRRISGSIGLLGEAAAANDSSLSREAFKALAEVGEAKDVDIVIDMLINLENEPARTEAERAVVVICDRTGMSEGIKKVVGSLKDTDDSKARLSLYTILGKSGSEEALVVLQKALKDTDDQVKIAAIRALSQWPQGGAATDLMKVVKTSDNQIHKVLALRGFIKLVPLENLRSARKVEMLKQAMEISNVNEKRMVFSSLAQILSLESLQLCDSYLDDAAIQKEAAAAVLVLAEDDNLGKTYPDDIRLVITKIAGMSELGSASDTAKELLEE